MNNNRQQTRIIWKSAGLHLMEPTLGNWLAVTPDLLRAYFTRPELHPVDESCAQEHALFERLMAKPDEAVADDEIDRIADRDAAGNWRIMLGFRDHLLAHGTIEGAYRALFAQPAAPRIPPVFIDQMAHLIVAGMLAGEDDPFVARAGEIFFREQKVTTVDGRIMLADREIVEMYSETGGFGALGGLLREAGAPMQEISLDVLSETNRQSYWQRADRFDFALDFRFTEPGPDALARVVEHWVRHFHAADIRVQAMQSIRDERWSWHVGLDAEATRILNDLYEGRAPAQAAADRMIGLFRLEFLDQDDVIDSMRGKAVYLGLAMTADGLVRVKPQNLLVNLPVRERN